jgi:hypothetical protein
MSVQLTIPSEQCLQRLSLQESDANTLREIISRYSPPETFCQALSWLVHRICNAFASLCGMSDWQKGQKIIHDNVLRLAEEEGIIQAQRLERNDESLSENDLLRTVERVAEIAEPFLDHCLRYNFVLVNERRPELEGTDIRNLILDLRDRVQGAIDNFLQARELVVE